MLRKGRGLALLLAVSVSGPAGATRGARAAEESSVYARATEARAQSMAIEPAATTDSSLFKTASHSSYSLLGDAPCNGECGGSCTSCRSGGLVAGAEATVLVGHRGSLAVTIPAANVSDFVITPEYDEEVSPRFWIGYEAPNGLGFRARYWLYDHGASGTSLPQIADIDLLSSLEAEALDGEFMQTGTFCDWDVEFAGGVRWGRVEEGLTLTGDIGDPVEASLFRDFEGIGPTVALSVRRPVGCRGLSLVGGARASLLFGDDTFTIRENVIGLLDNISLDAEDTVLSILELQVGVEWRRALASGSSLFARALFEGQTWELSPMLLGIGDSNIGFVGGSFGVGIDR